MKPALILVALLFLSAFTLRADWPSENDNKLSQEWMFALLASLNVQVAAGARDHEAIYKKAVEDAQPQEKKLRVSMQEAGFTPERIDREIELARYFYLIRGGAIGRCLQGKQ